MMKSDEYTQMNDAKLPETSLLLSHPYGRFEWKMRRMWLLSLITMSLFDVID